MRRGKGCQTAERQRELFCELICKEKLVQTHKCRSSWPTPNLDGDPAPLPLLTLCVFVSLPLTKAFRVRVQLREDGFQFVDIDVQNALKELVADFLEPRL